MVKKIILFTIITMIGVFCGYSIHKSKVLNVGSFSRPSSFDGVTSTAENFVATSASALNSFAGKVGIGKTTPTATLDVTQIGTTGNTAWFYRDLDSASTNSPLMFLEQDNAGDDQKALSIQQDGTGNTLFLDTNGNAISLNIDSEATTVHVFDINATNTSGNVVVWTFTGNHSDVTKDNFVINNTNTDSVVENVYFVSSGRGINTRIRNDVAGAGEVLQVIQDNASATANAQSIQNDGSGIGLLIDGAGTGYSAIFKKGNVGIGTSTPATKLEVHGTATTTISAMSETASKGARLILEDSDGAGCSEIYVLNGVITSAIVACPSN